jgi:hypothetical protein
VLVWISLQVRLKSWEPVLRRTNTGLIDIRTFTLHDPIDYKLRDIGNWVFNQELPVVTQYS